MFFLVLLGILWNKKAAKNTVVLLALKLGQKYNFERRATGI